MKRKIHEIYWAHYDTYVIGHLKCWVECNKFPQDNEKYKVTIRDRKAKKYYYDKTIYETSGGAREALLELLEKVCRA